MAGEGYQDASSSSESDAPTDAGNKMKQRQNISSGTVWEMRFGYSRAVRVGDHIHVAGTTSMKEGKLVGIGDAAAQAEQIFRNIEAALERAGSSIADVVRTRVYITRQADWEAVGKVHGRWFKDIRPAQSLIVVAGLVDPEMLVEIEAEAVVGCG